MNAFVLTVQAAGKKKPEKEKLTRYFEVGRYQTVRVTVGRHCKENGLKIVHAEEHRDGQEPQELPEGFFED